MLPLEMGFGVLW